MRRLRLAFGLTVTALTAFWACSFPDVTFGPAPGEQAGTNDGSVVTDTSTPDDAPVTVEEEAGPILIDGSTLDALIVDDAGGKVDASGCTTCDCDGDDFNDHSKPGCAASPGPNDCDDEDQRTHELQGFLTDLPEPPRNGDWDCNGVPEKLYTRENTTCSLSLETLLGLGLNCADIYGFTQPVTCGAQGPWVRCKKASGLLGLACEVDVQRIETQRCR